jgi:hypothetical protein
MAVEVNNDRIAVELKWDASALTGDTVNLKATNPDNNDVSTRDGIKNDGYATVTFPADYSGTAHITITDSEGNTEEGDITV